MKTLIASNIVKVILVISVLTVSLPFFAAFAKDDHSDNRTKCKVSGTLMDKVFEDGSTDAVFTVLLNQGDPAIQILGHSATHAFSSGIDGDFDEHGVLFILDCVNIDTSTGGLFKGQVCDRAGTAMLVNIVESPDPADGTLNGVWKLNQGTGELSGANDSGKISFDLINRIGTYEGTVRFPKDK